MDYHYNQICVGEFIIKYQWTAFLQSVNSSVCTNWNHFVICFAFILRHVGVIVWRITKRKRKYFWHRILTILVTPIISMAPRASVNSEAFSIAVGLPARTKKNQSRKHAKKVKCSSTSKRVRAHKSGQKTLRLDTYSKSWNMFAPPARAKRLQWQTAFTVNLLIGGF